MEVLFIILSIMFFALVKSLSNNDSTELDVKSDDKKDGNSRDYGPCGGGPCGGGG